jgi:citrate synthase
MKGKEMEKNEQTWYSAITETAPNSIRLRGYRIDELMGHISFAQTVFLAFTGRLPSDEEGRLLDAILVSGIDHGTTPPSTLAARTVASCDVPLTSALAAGILAIGKAHGGAVEECMEVVRKTVALADDAGITLDESAERMVAEASASGRRLPGLGHRYHTADPRALRLIELARECKFRGRHIPALQAIESAFIKAKKKSLPINVDGAIAACLCEMDFPSNAGNGFFIIARTAGLIVHILEECAREPKMRKIHPDAAVYDGPKERKLG